MSAPRRPAHDVLYGAQVQEDLTVVDAISYSSSVTKVGVRIGYEVRLEIWTKRYGGGGRP